MMYGLIGAHLGHSFSPQIHSLLGNDSYTLRELAEDELGLFLKRREFDGLNVTIPYKKSVIPYLDSISEEAGATGAVNTIVRRGNSLKGYNTDIYGFEALVRHSKVSLKGAKILILGAGGAAAAVAYVARQLGASLVEYATRRALNGCLPLTNASDAVQYRQFNILVNATPAGMYPSVDAIPVDISAFSSLSAVFDCVYNPLRTGLVLSAAKAGIPSEGGLYMLVAQACKSYELFTGSVVTTEFQEFVYRTLLLQMENIVLCGMPSSGKTTIGKALAESLGKPFYDTDLMIERRCGKSISDIFSSEGESGFRSMERDIIREISILNSAVISVGGGAVLSSDNVTNLKRNGRLILLDRDRGLLEAGGGRPLCTNTSDIHRLFNDRMPVYRSVADFVCPNNGGIEECVNIIIRMLHGS